MRTIYLILFAILLPCFLFGQTNTDFWFAAPEVTSDHGDNPIFLRLTAYNQTATVTITEPANTTTNFPPINVTIPANMTISVNLTAFKNQVECAPPNVTLNLGLHIHSNVPITVYYEVANYLNAEIFTLKGNNALGTSFYIPSQSALYNEPNFNPLAYNSFDIVATENGTTVTITPRKAIVGHAAGVPFNVTLNQGQVYSARSTGQQASDHLMGSVVASNKPIAITVKDDSDRYDGQPCSDLTGDQIVPVNIIGNDYIIVRGYTNGTMNDWVFVTATADNTQVSINGVLTTTLNAGYSFPYSMSFGNLCTSVHTNKPAYLWHLTGYGCEAGSSLLPSMDCTGSTQVAFTRTSSYSFEMIVLTKAGAQGSFTLDGNATLITAAMFASVPGNPAFVYARISFTSTSVPVGAHMLNNSADIFHMGIIQTYDAGQSGCAYGYFSDFASLNLGSDQTVCAGIPVTFDAGPNRISYAWFYNGAPYLTGVQTITVTSPGLYTVTVNDHGCMLTDSVHLLNHPSPNPVISGVTSFCQGTSQQLNVTGAFNAYLWSTGATTQAITVSSSGTYSVTVTGSNACTGSASAMVTAYPLPSVTFAQPPSTCLNTAPFALTGGTPSGGVYSGPGVNSTTGIFNPASGVGPHLITYSYTNANGCSNSASKTLTVNSVPPATLSTQPSVCASAPPFQLSGGWPSGGIYSGPGVNSATGIFDPASGIGGHLITYTYTDLNGCAGTASKTLTVYPVPSVQLGTQPSVCISSAPFLLTGGTPIGGVYSGTGVNSATGFFNPAIGSGGHQITYTYTDVNGCSNAAYKVLTVFPLPAVQLAQQPTVCISAPPFQLTGGIPAGGIYSGSGVNSVTGFFDPASGLGSHLITYTYTDGNGCINLDTKTLIVNPIPDVQLAAQPSVCFSVPPFLLTGGTPTGGVYSGSGVNSATGYFDPAIGTGTHLITYSYSDGSDCNGTASEFITVNPIPAVQLDDFQSVCISALPFQLSGGLPSGGVYSGPGVNSATGYFDPSAGAGTHAIIYTVTGGNGCQNSSSKPITVNPLPEIVLSGQDGTCIANPPFQLTFATPVGGTYSGSGVNSVTGFFDPASGVGPHLITYTFTDGNGCTAQASKTLMVYAFPDVALSLQNSTCISEPAFLLTGGSPAGGSYSGPGVNTTTGVFDPGSGAGPHLITYSYTDEFGCTNDDDQTIIVNLLPVVTLADQPPKCLSSPPFPLTGGSPSGGTYAGFGVNSVTGFFDPASGTGNHVITYTYTDGNGCSDHDFKTLTVLPLPVVSYTPQAPVCISVAPFPLTGGNPTGGIYSGAGVNGSTGIFSPGPMAGPMVITYSYTDLNGCPNSASDTLFVNPLPEVQLPVLDDACISVSPFALTGGVPEGGIYSGFGVNPSTGIFNPASGAGAREITYTYADANNCSNQANSNLTVVPLPTPAGIVTGPATVCEASQNIAYLLSMADPLATSFNWEIAPSGAGTITGNNTTPVVALNNGFSGNLAIRFQPVSNCGEGNFSAFTNITVSQAPDILFKPCNDQITTTGARPFLLKGGTPLGGSYSIDGVPLPTAILDPSLLSTTLTDHTVAYTYTNAYNCTASKSMTIKVFDIPEFNCKTTLTDLRDGQSYPTFEISIGGIKRCWMSANLNYGTLIDDQSPQTDNCIVEKYCGGNDISQCTESGAFYQWDELVTHLPSAEGTQGLCPPEWHVPTEVDWTELIYYYENPGYAGWQLLDPFSLNGFHAKPNGVLYQNFSHSFVPPAFSATIFWTSSIYSPDHSRVITHGLNSINPSVSTYFSLRGNALPARCIKD